MADILIVKCHKLLPHKHFLVILDQLKTQKETGVILLPPYLEAQIVPDDVEIKLVDENGKEENMKISEILKIVNDCERLRNVLMRDEELTAEDKMNICDLLWDYRCELLKKEV